MVGSVGKSLDGSVGGSLSGSIGCSVGGSFRPGTHGWIHTYIVLPQVK